MMKLDWIEHLRQRTLGHAFPKGRSRAPLSEYIEADITKTSADHDTVYRYEIIIGCDLRLSGLESQNPEAHEHLKERAVRMLARHMYKQQIDALYDLRDQMWKDGLSDDDTALRKLTDVLDAMTAK